MKEASYLCTSFHSGYSVEGYVYERDIWLREGLVLTDDNQALIPHHPRPNTYYNELYLRTVDGKQYRTGPSPEVLPSEPLPWYPFCVDGKWGVADADTGDVMVEPQWAFCDCFIENCARFSAKGDFSDPEKECYDGAFGMYDEALDIAIPPIFQHLSSMQDGLVLAKKNGKWGILDGYYDPDRTPESLFEWDDLTFAQGTIVAMKNMENGPRYTLLHSENYGCAAKVVMDGLTSVTVPKGEPWDGYHFRFRLIERDRQWGVLCCPSAEIVAVPELSRKKAEKIFWEYEGRASWEEDDDEDEEDQ